MSFRITRGMSICIAVAALLIPITADAGSQAAHGQQATIEVSGDVALSSLMTLGDGYLRKLADSFAALAATNDGRSEDPAVFAPALRVIAERNVSALVWRMRKSGEYWSVQEGEMPGNLSQRGYFTDVLAGKTVIGSLVVSTATKRSVAIVAVPIRDAAGAVIGAYGASVYLDKLSAQLRTEMALPDAAIFYSFDAEPLLALEWDPSLIFVDPLSLDPEVRGAFTYMLSRKDGTVRYRFRDEWRTILFRRSEVTGWWYALGVLQGHGATAK